MKYAAPMSPTRMRCVHVWLKCVSSKIIGMEILLHAAPTCFIFPHLSQVFPSPQRWWGRNGTRFLPYTLGQGKDRFRWPTSHIFTRIPLLYLYFKNTPGFLLTYFIKYYNTWMLRLFFCLVQYFSFYCWIAW